MKAFLPNWAYHDWTPPKAPKKDPAPFDTGKSSRKYRLFDGELKKTVEERPDESRSPYVLERRRPRQYRNRLTGELVQRYRGGKNFELVLAPWSPDGLVRRGRLLRRRPLTVSALHFGFGFSQSTWTDYPRGWAAEEPGPGPYAVRAVVELALRGADVSGCNIPGAAKFATRHLEANRLARDDVASPGPRLDERVAGARRLPFISIHGELDWRSTNLSPERAWYQAELSERKRFGRERVWVPGMPLYVDQGRRAKTSEHRNEQGEYGREVRLTHDGRLYFNKHKVPVINGSPIKVRHISSYTVERAVRLKTGHKRKMDVQRAPGDAITGRSKTGPKPQHGFAMDARLRKIKQRCKERGIPFVIADHLKLPAVSPPANSPAGAVSPRTRPPNSYQLLCMEIEHMITLLERDLAGEYHARLGELLDRLADAPPDYILSRKEFATIAAAAVLADRLLPKALH